MPFPTLTSADWKRGIESARSLPNIAWAQIQAKIMSDSVAGKPFYAASSNPRTAAYIPCNRGESPRAAPVLHS